MDALAAQQLAAAGGEVAPVAAEAEEGEDDDELLGEAEDLDADSEPAAGEESEREEG
jgi:hypothetical protein